MSAKKQQRRQSKQSGQLGQQGSQKQHGQQKQKKQQMGVLGLIIALVVVLIGGVLFVGAVAGWFDDNKITIDAEYYNAVEPGLVDLSKEEYEKLIEEKKSFMVFVDQSGCKTADKVRGFVENYAKEQGMKVYKMMFSDVKESSMHDYVKYYPSVVLVSHGKPMVWLRADADEDADAYNEEDAFQEWVGRYLVK